jgi:hypothetical protein
MTANEWLGVMKQAQDFPKGMEKLIIKYGEMLIAEHESKVKKLTIPVVMPRISHFIDENGTAVDLNAEGVNVRLKRDGTHEYFRSFGFAGRKELTPVYGA